MALADLQRALATLFTDERSREDFARDPARFAASFALSADDLRAIAGIGDARLRSYADGLDRKRANESARALPLSAASRGRAFRTAFLSHARAVPLGGGATRYRDDAIAFARRPGAHPLEAFEGVLLERLRAGARVVDVRLVACDLRATARESRVVPGKTLAVWFGRRSAPLLVALPSARASTPPAPVVRGKG